MLLQYIVQAAAGSFRSLGVCHHCYDCLAAGEGVAFFQGGGIVETSSNKTAKTSLATVVLMTLFSTRAISFARFSGEKRISSEAILESGGAVIQETRRWDEEKGISHPMRSKEEARDYRYFPEPDLVPVVIGEDYLERIRAAQPEMAWEKRQRFLEEYPIPEYDIRIITASRRMSDIFEAAVVLGSPPKKVSNWLMGETLRLLTIPWKEPRFFISVRVPISRAPLGRTDRFTSTLMEPSWSLQSPAPR